jgi:E3 ubiquitin-protein ligase UBR7
MNNSMTETTAEEDQNTVTALDYIEIQDQLEKDAQSILPGKFEKCTFPLGYVRQPLYACKTCSTEEKEPAGMCYSCSIACHSSHELFELFPKREFRCDCGLPGKFANHACSLMIPAKKIVKSNDRNKYNHNFEGRYCR